MALLTQLSDGVVINRFQLDKQTHTLGRHTDNDIVIDDVAVSTNHAVIEATENNYLDGYCDFILKDLGSTNGTFINDKQLEGERKLNSGDVVRLAWNKFKFVDEDEPEFDKTAHMLGDPNA